MAANYNDASFWNPGTRTVRSVNGYNSNGNNWEFAIPVDSSVKSGRVFSFIIDFNGYYCYRSLREVNQSGFTPYDVTSYMVQIKSISYQNNNVTILNNVINPVKNEITKLAYELETRGPVSIVVYDLQGDLVKVLVQGNESAGKHSVSWDGRNENGKIVVKGVYFIRVRAPGIFNQLRKVLIIK